MAGKRWMHTVAGPGRCRAVGAELIERTLQRYEDRARFRRHSTGHDLPLLELSAPLWSHDAVTQEKGFEDDERDLRQRLPCGLEELCIAGFVVPRCPGIGPLLGVPKIVDA